MALTDYFVVEISFDPPFGTLTWTDISSQVISASFSGGRKDGEGGPFVPSRLTLELDNNTANWDRSNTSSPYTGNIKRFLPIRLGYSNDSFVTTRYLGYWYLDELDVSATPFTGTATIVANDLLKRFSEHDIGDLERTKEFTGARLRAILDDYGLPAGLRGTLDDGTVRCDGVTLKENTLRAMQELQRTERGLLYVDPSDGTLHNRDRYGILDTAFSTSNITLDGDDVFHRPMTSSIIDSQDATTVKASGVSGRTFEYGTPGANEVPVVFHATNTQALYDADSEVAAESWFKGWEFGDQMFDSVPVRPLSAPAAVRTALMNGHLEPLKRIGVSVQPVGWSSAYTVDARIERWTHTIANENWDLLLHISPYDTTWQTESANFYEIGTTIGATDVLAL